MLKEKVILAFLEFTVSLEKVRRLLKTLEEISNNNDCVFVLILLIYVTGIGGFPI